MVFSVSVQALYSYLHVLEGQYSRTQINSCGKGVRGYEIKYSISESKLTSFDSEDINKSMG